MLTLFSYPDLSGVADNNPYGLKVYAFLKLCNLGLTSSQRDTHLLVMRMLDDLYWVMSFSRWKDERFWPLFRDLILRSNPGVTPDALGKAREFNFKRYHYQGIGRYEPSAAYARVSPISRYLQICFPEVDLCLVRNRAVSMRGYMDLWPTFISMKSTRR